MAYRDLSDAEQVEVLRPAALAAADRFGLDLVRLELVAHAYNTTFAADGANGARYALRVNTNSKSTPENVVAQQTWQRAITASTGVLVPEPRATPEGDWYVEVGCEALGGSLMVTAASWLAGPDVTQVDAAAARELGRTMAALHEQSRSWPLPAGAFLPRFDTPLFGDEDLLRSADGLGPVQQAVLDRALEETARVFARVYDGAPVQPLHADLHGGNLKWIRGRLAVFDFDDCGLGVPELDLAIAVFYLRGDVATLEQALRGGYADVSPLPDVDPTHFEALIAARQLLLANSLLASTTTQLHGEARNYLDVTVSRLRHWLGTGRFTRVPPGGWRRDDASTLAR